MSEPTFEHTIDWNRFRNEADDADRDRATPSSHHLTEVLAAFIAATGALDSVADVGCGPGVLTFNLADRCPDAIVYGYDAAESVLAENRERAREDGVENARFDPAALPSFDPGRRFDLVCCYATLYYVADPERALRNLYEAVAPGGYLLFNYPNRFARAHYRDVVDDPPAEVDPERFAERFRLVSDGENLLSYERIRDALGTWPQSARSIVDRPDKQWAWRDHPLVYVPK